jgi:hypothetical protein
MQSVKIPLVILAGFVFITAAMAVLNICPPQGPWPMPPWCGDKVHVISGITSESKEKTYKPGQELEQNIAQPKEEVQVEKGHAGVLVNFTVKVPSGTDKVYFEIIDFTIPFFFYLERYEMKSIDDNTFTLGVRLDENSFIRYRYSHGGEEQKEVDVEGKRVYRMFRQGVVSSVHDQVYKWMDSRESTTGTTSVSGKIVSYNGEPIIGALVEVGGRFGITNSYGEYEITGVPIYENKLTILEEKTRHPTPSQLIKLTTSTNTFNFSLKPTPVRKVVINVDVPEDTPRYAKVMIYGTAYDLGLSFHGDAETEGNGVYSIPIRPREMQKTGDNTWSIELELADGDYIEYGYTTGGPRVNVAKDESGKLEYYHITVSGDTVVNDTVYSWTNKNLKKVEFTVKAPSNTPKYSAIHVSFFNNPRLFRVGDAEFKNVFYLWPGKYNYSYSLDNTGYTYSPEAEPDTEPCSTESNPNCWVNKFSVDATSDTSVTDVITGWRWWPSSIDKRVPDSVVDETTILPRVDNEEFQSGVAIADWWWPSFTPLIEPTNQRMKSINVKWAQIDPVWDWLESEPVPKMTPRRGFSYSNEELKTHIRKMKQAGLKVLLAPEVCCSTIDASNRNDEWWEAYWREVDNFMNYFSKLADETGVDAIVFVGFHEALPGTSYSKAKSMWQQKLAKVRKNFKGPVGYELYTLDDGGLWNSEKIDQIADEFDFFGISMWAPACTQNNQGRQMIRDKVSRLFDSIEPLHTKWKKPFILAQIAYASAEKGCLGTKKYGVDDPRISYWEKKDLSTKNDMQTQAIVYDEILRAVASRPWITGTYPFGYYFHEMQDKAYNIRSKSAEEILSTWYEKYNSQ